MCRRAAVFFWIPAPRDLHPPKGSPRNERQTALAQSWFDRARASCVKNNSYGTDPHGERTGSRRRQPGQYNNAVCLPHAQTPQHHNDRDIVHPPLIASWNYTAAEPAPRDPAYHPADGRYRSTAEKNRGNDQNNNKDGFHWPSLHRNDENKNRKLLWHIQFSFSAWNFPWYKIGLPPAPGLC